MVSLEELLEAALTAESAARETKILENCIVSMYVCLASVACVGNRIEGKGREVSTQQQHTIKMAPGRSRKRVAVTAFYRLRRGGLQRHKKQYCGRQLIRG